MTKQQLLDRYDEDCVEQASDLWAKLQELPPHRQHAAICAAFKEYACEHDKRLTSDHWAQQYHDACVKLGEWHEKITEYIEASRCNVPADRVQKAWESLRALVA